MNDTFFQSMIDICFRSYCFMAIHIVIQFIQFKLVNRSLQYICGEGGCKTPTSNSNVSIPFVKYCAVNDIPNDVGFTIIEYENDTSEFPGK